MNWQKRSCPFGAWMMDSLVAQAKQNNDEELTGTDRMCVKRETLFWSVIVLYPGLHGLLGVVNQLLRYMFDRNDLDIKPFEANELLLCISGPKNKQLLLEEERKLHIWLESPDGLIQVRDLKKEHNYLTKELERRGDVATNA